MLQKNETLEDIKKLKSEGKLEEAIVLSGQLLSEDMYDPETYSLIGKIYYLLCDFDVASRYFLSALHIELLHAKREREINEVYLKETDAILSSINTPLIKDLAKSDLRRLLLLFGHTLIHLAHSLADDSINSGMAEEIIEYKEILKGANIETSEKYKKMETEFYLTLGLVFSLAVIDEKLTIKEVTTEYFIRDVNELKAIYFDALAILKKIH
ncbi:MAG: hypothetical protein COX48_04140 [bacterium (Candidatus Stahlbacteria) CG23_combo_of_CG06-09_8_20_14_all_34_7]|nr:MAG: hypothetical protein COX48_04140 [bacterium (Candidatus Stahlbacteria) CG23_combo_of_CG06-09_8_20_14_all_34_7]